MRQNFFYVWHFNITQRTLHPEPWTIQIKFSLLTPAYCGVLALLFIEEFLSTLNTHGRKLSPSCEFWCLLTFIMDWFCLVFVILTKFVLFVSQDTHTSISYYIWSINQSMGIRNHCISESWQVRIENDLGTPTEMPKRWHTHAGPAGGGTFSLSFMGTRVDSLRHKYVSAGSDAVSNCCRRNIACLKWWRVQILGSTIFAMVLLRSLLLLHHHKVRDYSRNPSCLRLQCRWPESHNRCRSFFLNAPPCGPFLCFPYAPYLAVPNFTGKNCCPNRA